MAGNELAHEWVGKITRKVVKRAVMTTPYGVTERGIAEQLMSDGHTEGMDQRAKAATYLKNKIVVALDETVTSAKQIMAWLQAVAATPRVATRQYGAGLSRLAVGSASVRTASGVTAEEVLVHPSVRCFIRVGSSTVKRVAASPARQVVLGQQWPRLLA